jgi:hypothetical protein
LFLRRNSVSDQSLRAGLLVGIHLAEQAEAGGPDRLTVGIDHRSRAGRACGMRRRAAALALSSGGLDSIQLAQAVKDSITEGRELRSVE